LLFTAVAFVVKLKKPGSAIADERIEKATVEKGEEVTVCSSSVKNTCG